MRTLGRRALVRAATLSAASVLGIAAAWVGAAPAAAATITSASTAGAGTAIGAAMAAPAGCPSGALCVYSGLNFTGSHSYLFDCNRTWVTFGRNDINESWYNNGTSGRWARIWQNVNFTGNFFAIAPGVGVLDGHGTGVYNAGSSNDWPPPPGTAPPPPPSQCPG